MRVSFLLAAAAIAASAVPAVAADMFVPAEPAPEIALAFNWSGLYVGGTLGAISASADVTDILFEGEDAGIDDFTIDSPGALLGVTIGVNQQWDTIVGGLEADLSWSNAEGSYTDEEAGFISTARLQSFATLRGRLGFAADRFLVYGTAGLAYGSLEGQLDDDYDGDTITTVDTQSLFGWTAGIGAEAAVSDNVTVKGEALYYDLGDATFTYDEGAEGWSPITTEVGASGWLGRFGVNFKF